MPVAGAWRYVLHDHPATKGFTMRKRLILAALLSSFLTGCVVATTPYYSAGVVYQPPPVRYEYPGPPPAAGYLWIGGNWTLVGQRHEWRPGYWVPPRPASRWVEPPRVVERHWHAVPESRRDWSRHERHDHWRDVRRDGGRHDRRGPGDWR